MFTSIFMASAAARAAIAGVLLAALWLATWWAALASCLELPAGSRPLVVSHGIALGCLVSTILGLPPYAERRLRLRNCSISRVDYQQSPWLASGWVVETAGDVSHLDAPAMDELQR